MIFPMIAMVALTFAVSVTMFIARVRAIRSRQMDRRWFVNFTGGESPPEAVIKTARHYSNLFEMPVLFYAACLASMILTLEGPLMRGLAWTFVAARVAHAAIHLGPNALIPRMLAFMAGCAAVAALWIAIAIAAIGARAF